MYRSFFSLGRYTPKYFILFVAMVNGIVSLISLSVFSLLVYRNARDFCVLITLYAKQKETQMYRTDFWTLWRKRGWDVSREQHQNMYII